MYLGRTLAKNISFLNAKPTRCYPKQLAVFIIVNGGEGGIREKYLFI